MYFVTALLNNCRTVSTCETIERSENYEHRILPVKYILVLKKEPRHEDIAIGERKFSSKQF
jgi:hypothetical protein